MPNLLVKKYATALAISLALLSGCSDDEPFKNPGDSSADSTNPISQNNFSILADNFQPTVIDPVTSFFTETDVTLSVSIGDRNNEKIVAARTINFRSEYGLIEPSCVTEDGTCSVVWTAIKPPDPGGPGDDMYVTITAYTTGEESFTDTNGNGVFDDGDAAFDDLEEPYVDADLTFGLSPDLGGTFNTNDRVIDVISTNDPTGNNLVHDLADGFYNGTGCTHSSLCGTRTSVVIWDDIAIKIDGPAAPTYTIGGTATGIPVGTDLVLDNGGESLTVTGGGTGTDNFTFATAVADGGSYNVTVTTIPLGTSSCTPSSNTGTVSGIDVTTVSIACVP